MGQSNSTAFSKVPSDQTELLWNIFDNTAVSNVLASSSKLQGSGAPEEKPCLFPLQSEESYQSETSNQVCVKCVTLTLII